MKTELKEIILMGLGALSLTDEKAEELKQKLLKKGEKLYNEGLVKNEELKRNIQEKIKENTNIQVTPVSKEIIVEYINSIDDKEKEEIITLLNQDEKNNPPAQIQDNACKGPGRTAQLPSFSLLFIWDIGNIQGSIE